MPALNDRRAAGLTGAAAMMAANQLAFARYIVEPTLEGLMTIAPGAVEVMLDRLRGKTPPSTRDWLRGKPWSSVKVVIAS